MASKHSLQLSAAMRNRVLVRFTRPLERGSVVGYVVAIGPRFFMVAPVSHDIRFNGFQCFRLSDVRSLKVPNSRADFFEKALKLRGERMPKKPRVDLRSLESLLISANRSFPLVTIHLEVADRDVCHIGRVKGIARGRIILLEIDAHAVWKAEATEYRLSEITRVDFGGDYEEALHMVGGDPTAK